MPLAERVVGFARDTIQYLARLNNTTELYRRIQVFYHQFLTSAIAVLFLASTHAPLQFSAACRTEFYLALEQIKNLSTRSWVSHRLWKTIGSLKSYATRLGMEEQDPHSGAAAAMASMASGNPRGSSASAAPSPSQLPPSYGGGVIQPPQPPNSSVSTPTPQQIQQQLAEDHKNGLWLQTEMSRIYEGYTGMSGISNTLAQPPEQPPPPVRGSVAELVETGPAVEDDRQDSPESTQNGGVYQHFKNMF